MASVEIYGTNFITVGKALDANLWDTETGKLLISFTLPIPTDFNSALIPSINITMNHRYIAYGFEDASYFVISIPLFSSSEFKTTDLMCFKHSESDEHGFTYAPQTITLFGNTLVTNGAFPDEISVWNLQEKRLICHHSELLFTSI